MYLTKTGEQLAVLPNLDDYIDLSDHPVMLEAHHIVRVYTQTPIEAGLQWNDLRNGVQLIAEVPFYNEPSKDQILWCLLRHKGEFAEVQKVYTTTDLPF